MTFVIFAGQSNALGFGMSAGTLPPGYGEPDPLTYIWNNEAGWYEMMRPGLNTGASGDPDAWGPEVGFAYNFRLAHPGEILIIVKSAKGSTGLAEDPDALDWSPRSEGEMFDLTAERVAAARAYINYPLVDAVFLVQGEQDAFDLGKANDYQANLTDWLGAIRTSWMDDAEGRIVIARLIDAEPYFETVRWAQVLTDRDDPNAASFDTYSYAKQPDQQHFAAAGHLDIGASFQSLYDHWV